MTFRITFLGTGGGRHTTMYQTRCTGGMLIEHGEPAMRLHVDPGPGALTQMNRIHYDLGTTDSVVISHAHPDHYSDAASVIEGMTHGGWVKRGWTYGSTSVVNGEKGLGPVLSPYHMKLTNGITAFRPGDVLNIDGLRTDICYARHSDPTNVGFKFHTPNGIVSYVSDTEYDEDIGKQYIGSRVLILPVTTPHGNEIPYHMCTDTAVEMLNLVKPELAIFIHLGIVILKADPEKEVEFCEKETGVRTIAGKDLMVLDVGEKLELSMAKTYDDPGSWIPPWSP
ncbi:MAG: MBL fold metallo-hydrolase [archaeon]|nr:MBL fold metallo-hydrolase [archaeon]